MYRVCKICGVEKHIDNFYTIVSKSGKFYKRRICSVCHHRNQIRTRIPLTEIRPYLNEIIIRCGGINPAAKLLNTQTTVIRRWMGKSLRYDNGKVFRDKRMTRESAARILSTLRQLRTDGVFYEHSNGRRPAWMSVDDTDAERKRKERRETISN